MNMKKKIFLTFDYEVFLFESGCPKKSLFNPTERILNILEEKNIKAIFFIDILYYHRILSIESQIENCMIFEKQVQKMIKNGHDVELHLHTHWLDANLVKGNWSLSNLNHYKLSSFNISEIDLLFDLGIKLLSKICTKIDSNYRVKSFRAGGLCILPFELILNSFKKHQISFDSSIAAGHKSEFSNHAYDHSEITLKQPYFFSETPLFNDLSGGFIEFPLSWFKVNFVEKLLLKFKKSKHDKFNFVGKGIPLNSIKKNGLFKKFSSATYFYSVDHSTVSFSLLNRKIKRYSGEYLTFMSHPKLMSEKSFLLFKKLTSSDFIFLKFSDFKQNNYKNAF